MVNALRLVKKQWFIVNHSENSQRFMVTLYFWKSTTTTQFFICFMRQKLQAGLRTGSESWSVLQNFGECITHGELCRLKEWPHSWESGMNCALFNDGLSLAQAASFMGWVGSLIMAEFKSPGLTQLLFTKHTHAPAYSRKILISLCIRNILSNFFIKNLPFHSPACDFP